jgi:hypothetical protein
MMVLSCDQAPHSTDRHRTREVRRRRRLTCHPSEDESPKSTVIDRQGVTGRRCGTIFEMHFRHRRRQLAAAAAAAAAAAVAVVFATVLAMHLATVIVDVAITEIVS